MEPTQKIYRSNSLYNFNTLQLLEKINFPTCLENFDSKNYLAYALLVDPENLFYTVKLPEVQNFDKVLKQGEFKADLWKQDLVELFISSDEGTSYQEINLAPSGAYWAVSFLDYRVRIPDTEIALNGIEFEIRTTILGKILSLKVPLTSLIAGCTFTEKSRLNCCAIIGQNLRNYYATSNLDPVKPDFHEIAKWAKTEQISIV